MSRARTSKVPMPKDVHEEHFKEVMAGIPPGFRFLRSYRTRFWRTFVFHVDRPAFDRQKQGDRFETSVVLKFQ